MSAKNRIRILVLNGPNLNLLGSREPEVYGKETLADIERRTAARAAELGAARDANISVDFRQSNSEADLIDWVGATPGKFDGIILNPAALTHSSIGLLDAIKAVGPDRSRKGVPAVEVHLSNTLAREEFRHKSITAAGCIGQVMGFQAAGYLLALDGLVDYLLRTRA